MPLLVSPLRSGEEKKKKRQRGPVSSHLPGAVVRARGEEREREREKGREKKNREKDGNTHSKAHHHHYKK